MKLHDEQPDFIKMSETERLEYLNQSARERLEILENATKRKPKAPSKELVKRERIARELSLELDVVNRVIDYYKELGKRSKKDG